MRYTAAFFALAVVVVVEAIVMQCPDTAAMETCVLRFDADHDAKLQRPEFEDAFDNVGWFSRQILPTPDTFMENCDLNQDGGLTAGELQSGLCMRTCEQQSLFYNAVCG